MGGGMTMVFAATDAIFLPLAQRQVVKAGRSTCSATVTTPRPRSPRPTSTSSKHEANSPRPRALDKAVELQKTVSGLSKGLVPFMEVDRVRAAAADLQQAEVSAREEWRTTSADLTRVLSPLIEAPLVTPLEPPYLQITLISPPGNGGQPDSDRAY